MKAATRVPAGDQKTNSTTKTRSQKLAVHANQLNHGHGGGSTGPGGEKPLAAQLHTTAAARAACGVAQRAAPAARTVGAASAPRALTTTLRDGRERCAARACERARWLGLRGARASHAAPAARARGSRTASGRARRAVGARSTRRRTHRPPAGRGCRARCRAARRGGQHLQSARDVRVSHGATALRVCVHAARQASAPYRWR